MPFNIFVGPRERSFDLGQSLDIEGRALLPDDLILSLTNVYHTMIRINDNQEVSETEINTLRDDLISLLDYDLESQEFDSDLWIEQNQTEGKSALLFSNILKKSGNFVSISRELLTFHSKKIPLNKIKEIKIQIKHVFDLVFNLIEENPELLEKYGDRLLHNPLSIDLNEFLQEILTINPNLFISISSFNNRNSNQNNIIVVYKLSKHKINNAHKILMCDLLNKVNVKLNSTPKVNGKSRKNLNQFISIMNALLPDCSILDKIIQKFTTTTEINEESNNKDDDDDTGNDRKKLRLNDILNSLFDVNPNILLDTIITSTTYVTNILLPLMEQMNSKRCTLYPNVITFKSIVRRTSRTNNLVASIDRNPGNAIFSNIYSEIIGVSIKNVSYLYYEHDINKWIWTHNYSLFFDKIVLYHYNKISINEDEVKRNLFKLCHQKKQYNYSPQLTTTGWFLHIITFSLWP